MDPVKSDPLNPTVPSVPSPQTALTPTPSNIDQEIEAATPAAEAATTQSETTDDTDTGTAVESGTETNSAETGAAPATGQKQSVVDNLNQQKQQLFDAMAAEKARVLANTKGIDVNSNPLQGLPGLDYLVAAEIVHALQHMVDQAVDARLKKLSAELAAGTPTQQTPAEGEPTSP